MSNTDYIATVICYYAKNKVKIGTLTFDQKANRFIILDSKNKKSKSFPDDGIHCGDIYIVQDNRGSWKIGQCELDDGVWRLLGTDLHQENCNNNMILYVNHKRLERITDTWITQEFDVGVLSDKLIIRLMS